MVDVQIVRRATDLTAPSVPFEHFIAKRFVLGQRELQRRHLMMKFAHELL
jgi:hypothetical protein